MTHIYRYSLDNYKIVHCLNFHDIHTCLILRFDRTVVVVALIHSGTICINQT
ncbi:hypothetical protein ACJX0J_024737, partial [Zea mays]